MNLDLINQELIASKEYVATFSPGPDKLFLGTASKAWKYIGWARKWRKIVKKHLDGVPVSTQVGDYVGGKVIDKTVARTTVKDRILKVHLFMMHKYDDPISQKAKPMATTRSWYDKPTRVTMTIVFHDANKAGPHIDVHIGELSVIYRVKPELYATLRFNRDGYLTQDSQKALIDHVKSEIAGGSRVPQNLDHNLDDANTEWVKGGTDGTEYGAGPTRQVISTSEVDIYKAQADGPIEFYAPVLNPHRSMYLYRLYPGTDTRAPILIWGNKKSHPPVLEDRLHLKMVHPEEMDKLEQKADMSTSTAKYDGSSAYFVIGPKGTSAWSPRKSVVTGEQIEYTFKLDGIAEVTSPETIVAMGEILFKDSKGNYLPCAQGSGILNSNIVLPADVTPEVRLYRVDKFGRKRTSDYSFWDNRILQNEVASLDPEHFKVAELMEPEEALKRGFEGVVVAPRTAKMVRVHHYKEEGVGPVTTDLLVEAGPVNDGYKVKWWSDDHDWRLDDINFSEGERGGLAGVATFTSLESGKQFNLGPGGVGSHEECKDMATHPELYIGRVAKVHSRQGHEGRASKLVQWHDDK